MKIKILNFMKIYSSRILFAVVLVACSIFAFRIIAFSAECKTVLVMSPEALYELSYDAVIVNHSGMSYIEQNDVKIKKILKNIFSSIDEGSVANYVPPISMDSDAYLILYPLPDNEYSLQSVYLYMSNGTNTLKMNYYFNSDSKGTVNLCDNKVLDKPFDKKMFATDN